MSAVPARPGPTLVFTGAGSVDELPDVLALDGATRVLFVHGTRSLRAARPFLPELPGVALVEAEFRGECSPGEIARLIDRGLAEQVDAVLGLGGGKVLDTAKAVGHALSRPVLLVPTLASTCSGWSAVSVYYDDDHRHLGHEDWNTPSRALFLDPRIVFDSPLPLFVSGIADTLAKHVETRAAFTAIGPSDTLAAFGASAAERCGLLAREQGPAAVADMRRGVRSDAWTAVAEAAVVTAGLVGSLGAVHGRATAAHPVSDGLSAIDTTRDLLHGVKVAYGIVVQLALESRWNEVDALRPVYAALGLPQTLADLGLDVDDAATLETIARVATVPTASTHLLVPDPSTADVVAAMHALETHQAGLPRIVLAGTETLTA